MKDYLTLLRKKTRLEGTDKTDKSTLVSLVSSGMAQKSFSGKWATNAANSEKSETSWGWWIAFPDRDPVSSYYTPEADIEQVRRDYPTATTIVPYELPIQSSATPLTAEEESAIRGWLAHIEETNPEIIAEVIERCQRDTDARAYFVGRARGL
ncbi:MAG: hypothetical protein LBQ81_08450 [Zoogloeaceae bacterium]|jgi:hypothetical protein|nr:hypothetical protein [Zoogloeaceae bacterium]